MGLTISAILAAVTIGQPPPLSLEKTNERPDITARFTRTDGWTGADGAYTVRLGTDRLVWLFSDTWIGKVENGRRQDARMVNNTVGVQSLRDPRAPLQFFWGRDGDRTAALLKPAEADRWYWLESGAVVGDQLYLFCKVVRRSERGRPGFQFDWFGNDLLRIANPMDDPTAWKAERIALPTFDGMPRLGAACVSDGEHLYVYGLFPDSQWKPLHRPLAVARIALGALAKPQAEAWEFWCRGTGAPRWSPKPDDLVPLFNDGAPELSISRVRGVAGFVATYTPIGLGPDIAVRHALRPEGPWSAALNVYRAPNAGEKVFYYGAKAHPDLAERDGQLVITFCRNVGDLGEHMRRPDVYVPQGVEVILRPTPDRR